MTVQRYITCAGPQPDSSQEDVAGQGLFVPDGELQADVVEVSLLQAAVSEGVVPVRVHRASLHHRLVLGRLVAVGQQVSRQRNTPLLLNTVPVNHITNAAASHPLTKGSEVPPDLTAVRFLAPLTSSSTMPPLGRVKVLFFLPFMKPFFTEDETSLL